MNIEENIQGHPRSFVASYAKDIVCAFIQTREYVDNPKGAEMDFTKFAGLIYDWVMQDAYKPMTDAQYTLISDVLQYGKLDPELKKRIEGNYRSYNVKQASEVITSLLSDHLPPEYQDTVTYRQRDIMKAVQNRTQRK